VRWLLSDAQVWSVDDADPTRNVVTRPRAGGAAQLAARYGAKLVLERYVCDLREMRCRWNATDGDPDAPPLELPRLELGFSRLKMRTAKVQVVATRNAMVNLNGGGDGGGGGGGGEAATELDCARVKAWPRARYACRQLMQGTAPPAKQQEWMLLLVTPWLRADQRFHFMQVDLPLLQYEQPKVHGLLGQRAIAPKPVDAAAAARAHDAQRSAAREAARRRLFEDDTPSGTVGNTVGPGGGGGGGGGGGRADARAPGAGGAAAAADIDVDRDEAAEREAEPMLHAAIEATGLQQEAARRFGSQGEGAIAGRWTEYAVAHLDEHHRFRYARLTCDRGDDGERAAAEQIMGTAQVETQTA